MPNKLEQFLISEIKERGPMDVGAFMSHALMHPDYGYYTNSDPFGKRGDFVTSPEISQMFGEVIGAWVVDIWKQMGAPKKINLIECGPGRGTFMADIIRVALPVDGFGDALHVHLIEGSGFLQKQQKTTLSGLKNISWHNDFSNLDVDTPCIILGNEFIDALPVRQVMRGPRGWQERVVIAIDDVLSFDWAMAGPELKHLLPFKTISDQIFELSPERNNFIDNCCDLLKKAAGAALFIDYGHNKSSSGDTLQAIKKHEFIDVLHDVGECDITAHVDFEALQHMVERNGLSAKHIATQRGFLLRLGIMHRAQALKKIASDGGARIEADFERLTGSDQMGDLFKIMCFYHGYNLTPAGFSA